MVSAITSTFGVLPGDVMITEHYPEAFMLRFIHPHSCALAVGRHDFFFEGLKVHVRPWRLEENAEHIDLIHHVRL